jgi:hypothetical protein
VRGWCGGGSVQSFQYVFVKGDPAGPLAPPTRCARLRSRWRSRYGGAHAGRLARKDGCLWATAVTRVRRRVLAPAAGLSRAEPVKAVCGRRAIAPMKLPGERTREDDLDRTCPAKGNLRQFSRTNSECYQYGNSSAVSVPGKSPGCGERFTNRHLSRAQYTLAARWQTAGWLSPEPQSPL